MVIRNCSMWSAGNWSEESSGKFSKQLGTTYTVCSVALEGAVMDVHIGTTGGINSSTLEVACPPPGIGAKI